MPKTPTKQSPEKPTPARPERPHKTLTKTQEEIADLASDLILNGGAHEDVNLLLTALLRHQYRRFSFGGRNEYKTAAQREQSTREHAERRLPEHYASLSARWPKEPPVANGESELPKTVTEMVRANIRGSLQERFDEFMTDMDGIEPVWLLNEILGDAHSEGDLMQAIYYSMDRSDIYVRVPYKHHDRIQEFVEFLEGEAGGRRAA